MIGSTSLDNMKQNHKQLCRGRSRLPALYQELSHKYLLPVQPVGVVTLDSVTILHSTKRLLNKPQALYQTFSVLCGIHKNVEILLDPEDLKWNFWAASDPFSSREAFRLNCCCVEAIHHGKNHKKRCLHRTVMQYQLQSHLQMTRHQNKISSQSTNDYKQC